MIVKKYAVALMAVAFLTAGFVSPAHAQVPETELVGPGGAFKIGQSGDGASDIQRSSANVNNAEGISETLLQSSVLNHSNASESYSLTLPESATAEVITNDLGQESVLLLNGAGELLGGIASEDVLDANDAEVPTSFSVDGTTVTQSLQPAESADVAYPVSMSARAATEWYSAGWVTTESRGYIVNAAPTAMGKQQIAWNTHYIHVAHLKQILGTQAYRVNNNIEQQFVCHVVGGYLDSGVYNMESWRPDLPWQQIANPWDRCNRD